MGELDEAASCYEKAIALAPDYVLAHYNLAYVRQDQVRADSPFLYEGVHVSVLLVGAIVLGLLPRHIYAIDSTADAKDQKLISDDTSVSCCGPTIIAAKHIIRNIQGQKRPPNRPTGFGRSVSEHP